MALERVVYVDGMTTIHAKNLNDIQDAIIANEAEISEKIGSEELESHVQDVMQQAKESGDFNGEPGADGKSVTITNISESSEDGGSNVVTFSDGKKLNVKNGKTGTPGKDYVLTEVDKAEIVNHILQSWGGNPVYGYIDENKRIVFSSNIPDGTYSGAYEDEDGAVVAMIGQLVKESVVVITNWIEEVGYITGTRLSLSSGGETTSGATDYECSRFIPAKYGDELYIENVDLANETATNIVFYDGEKNPIAVNGTAHGITLNWLFVTSGTQTGNGYSSHLEVRGSLSALPETFDGFIRIGSKSITNESVLNIKRNGQWL